MTQGPEQKAQAEASLCAVSCLKRMQLMGPTLIVVVLYSLKMVALFHLIVP
jgi:hypothetical protein